MLKSALNKSALRYRRSKGGAIPRSDQTGKQRHRDSNVTYSPKVTLIVVFMLVLMLGNLRAGLVVSFVDSTRHAVCHHC